jgi:hypothetical protein
LHHAKNQLCFDGPYFLQSSLNRLRWFGNVQRIEENRIPKRVLYMNLEKKLIVSPRNRWQNKVREVGRIDGGEE